MNNVTPWPRDPWTVVAMADEVSKYFYAFNTRTGERKPIQDTYDEAYETIPQ